MPAYDFSLFSYSSHTHTQVARWRRSFSKLEGKFWKRFFSWKNWLVGNKLICNHREERDLNEGEKLVEKVEEEEGEEKKKSIRRMTGRFPNEWLSANSIKGLSLWASGSFTRVASLFRVTRGRLVANCEQFRGRIFVGKLEKFLGAAAMKNRWSVESSGVLITVLERIRPMSKRAIPPPVQSERGG